MKNYHDDINCINSLNEAIIGHVKNGIKSIVSRDGNGYSISINETNNLKSNIEEYAFTSNNITLEIKAIITSNHTNINSTESTLDYGSTGHIYSFNNSAFSKDKKCIYRAYYQVESLGFLYYCLDIKRDDVVKVNNIEISLHQTSGFLIIESISNVSYADFNEICYAIMVAVGFVSGKFIQDEVYIFQYEDSQPKNKLAFMYRHLRSSSRSIYEALTTNPYGYKHYIGYELADDIYKRKILTAFDMNELSKLSEVVFYNRQILYALVLFNESIDSRLSLLVKNNSLYIVLEVLRKFLYEKFISKIPEGYSSKGNTDKYAIVFGIVTNITPEDTSCLTARNNFLHGDIEEISDYDMQNIFLRQITLIRKVVLSYTKFEGYIIDHHALNNNIDEFLIKLGDESR